MVAIALHTYVAGFAMLRAVQWSIQGAAVSNEKSLFTHRFNRWRWPQKDCDF